MVGGVTWLDEVGHWDHAFEEYLIPGAFLSCKVFLAAMKWATLFCHSFCHDVLTDHRPRDMEPSSDGLRSLKSWAKINLIPFKLVFLSICHNDKNPIHMAKAHPSNHSVGLSGHQPTSEAISGLTRSHLISITQIFLSLRKCQGCRNSMPGIQEKTRQIICYTAGNNYIFKPDHMILLPLCLLSLHGWRLSILPSCHTATSSALHCIF